MLQEKNKTIKIIISWFFVVLTMGLIFYFSSRTSNESTGQSNFIIELIYKIFSRQLSEIIVRKGAHFCEYASLGFFTFFAFKSCILKKTIMFSILFDIAYAISDEIHQIFVPGRSCQITDILVDSIGSFTGVIIALALFNLIYLLKRTNSN